jgi:hypothetical protein
VLDGSRIGAQATSRAATAAQEAKRGAKTRIRRTAERVTEPEAGRAARQAIHPAAVVEAGSELREAMGDRALRVPPAVPEAMQTRTILLTVCRAEAAVAPAWPIPAMEVAAEAVEAPHRSALARRSTSMEMSV